MASNVEQRQEKETTRLEAFSDGVFAIAITLLALELRDPTAGGSVPLREGLMGAWPSFLALATSFVTILIMWMNHHNMFNYIRRVDRRFMFLNGLLLLFVTLTPFTTSLVAEHILSADATSAAGVYSGGFFLLAVVWNTLWRYASRGHRLLGTEVSADQVRSINRQYLVAPVSYAAALLISYLNGLASFLVIILVAGFFAVTATMTK